MSDRSSRLRDVVTPIGESVASAELAPETTYVGLADLDERGELIDGGRPLADVKSPTSLQRFRSGDLLCGVTRGPLKVWLADRGGVCTGSFAVLRPRPSVAARPLLWRLRAAALFGWPPTRRGLLDVTLPPFADDVGSHAVIDRLDEISRLQKMRAHTIEIAARLPTVIFDTSFGHPFAPRSGRLVPLGTLIKEIQSGWSPRCEDRPARAGEYGVIKLSAVSSGRFLPEENKALPAGLAPRRQLELVDGDLLMVRSNARSLVGATALARVSDARLLLTDKTWRLRPAACVTPVFLRALLSHPAVRERLSELATGSISSMTNLTQNTLLRLEVAAPPELPRQREHQHDLDHVEHLITGQRRHAELLDRLLDQQLRSLFSISSVPAPQAAPPTERAVYELLSALQQAVWRALGASDGPLSAAELAKRLPVQGVAQPGADELRRALRLLSALGAATRVRDSDFDRWQAAKRVSLERS